MVGLVAGLLITNLVGAALTELVKGPLQQTLGGIFPHDDVMVRSIAAMYVAGGVSRADFLASDAIKQIVESDRKVVVAYADYMKGLKDLAVKNAANKGVEKVLNDIDSENEKLQKEADDIELDNYALAVNTEIQNLEVDKKPYESLFYSAAKRGEQQPFLDALKSFNNTIAEFKQLILDKRTEILGRKRAALDSYVKTLPSISKITDIAGWVVPVVINPFAVPTVESLTETVLLIMSAEQITPTPTYVLTKAGYEVNDVNLQTAANAILAAQNINPAPLPPAPTAPTEVVGITPAVTTPTGYPSPPSPLTLTLETATTEALTQLALDLIVKYGLRPTPDELLYYAGVAVDKTRHDSAVNALVNAALKLGQVDRSVGTEQSHVYAAPAFLLYTFTWYGGNYAYFASQRISELNGLPQVPSKEYMDSVYLPILTPTPAPAYVQPLLTANERSVVNGMMLIAYNVNPETKDNLLYRWKNAQPELYNLAKTAYGFSENKLYELVTIAFDSWKADLLP